MWHESELAGIIHTMRAHHSLAGAMRTAALAALLLALPAGGMHTGLGRAARSSRVASPRARIALAATEVAVAAAAPASSALTGTPLAAPTGKAAKGGKSGDSGKKKAGSSGAPGQPLVIGLSHHTANVEVRERLAVKEAEWNNASKLILERCASVQEAAVLSTCNRFELHLVASDRNAAIRDVLEYLVERSGLEESVLWENLFMLSGEDAVWHLLRVSAGLDSLVVGEGQILSQVRFSARKRSAARFAPQAGRWTAAALAPSADARPRSC